MTWSVRFLGSLSDTMFSCSTPIRVRVLEAFLAPLSPAASGSSHTPIRGLGTLIVSRALPKCPPPALVPSSENVGTNSPTLIALRMSSTRIMSNLYSWRGNCKSFARFKCDRNIRLFSPLCEYTLYFVLSGSSPNRRRVIYALYVIGIIPRFNSADHPILYSSLNG